MKTKDFISILERKYPKVLAEEWDNVGLLVGDAEKEVHNILLALDVTEEVIDFAVTHSFDMIISHHPIIFRGIKRVLQQDVLGAKIFKLVKHGINVYTLHTNLDAQKAGLNDYILEKLGVTVSTVLEKREDGTGIGRMFQYPEGKSVEEIQKLLSHKLGLSFQRYIGNDMQQVVHRVCLVNGSGMSYWRMAKSKGAELFITGDVSYHDALDAKECGMSVIDMGHYEAEYFFAELLMRDFKHTLLKFQIFESKPVFQFIK